MAEKKGSSMSLAFGLCMKYGIKIMPEWTPRDAWNALYKAKKITPEQAYSEYKEKNAKRSRILKLPSKEYLKYVVQYVQFMLIKYLQSVNCYMEMIFIAIDTTRNKKR